MEAAIVVLVLLGCTQNGLFCRDISNPQDRYTTLDRCVTALNEAVELPRSDSLQVRGTCLDERASDTTKRKWVLDWEGRLASNVDREPAAASADNQHNSGRGVKRQHPDLPGNMTRVRVTRGGADGVSSETFIVTRQ